MGTIGVLMRDEGPLGADEEDVASDGFLSVFFTKVRYQDNPFNEIQAKGVV